MGVITGLINLNDAIFEVKLSMRSLIYAFENDFSPAMLLAQIYATKATLQMSVYFMDEVYFNRYNLIVTDILTPNAVEKMNVNVLNDLKALQTDIEKIPHRQ